MLIKFTDATIDVREVDHPSWLECEPARVTRYWSGEEAPIGRHVEVRSLWTKSHLFVRFLANQSEPLVVSETPVHDRKTVGLWDRDVCEIFIAPDPEDPSRYFEFEVAPTGEWIDLGIRQMPDARETDWEFDSGMRAFGAVGDGVVVSTIAVPWSSIGVDARSGLVLRGNLLRCVGSGEARGYLAWRPTRTAVPNFHVSEVFGELRLVD